jgi:hypothetical protein
MAREGQSAAPELGERMLDFGGVARKTTEIERKRAGVRPTGQEIFDSLSKAEQDEMLGPAAAEQVRKGEATLADFVKEDGGFITQRPVEDL